MDLTNLKETMPFKWRVQSFSKFKEQGQCVAYVDARDVQNRLDSVCGQQNWQDLYYQVGNMLFCKVGIKVGDEWVWKSDTGSESNIEKEKGYSSDAFKRACVKWGVGRFLYDMKIQYVKANEKKTKTNFPHVIDNNGKRVWDLTAHINSKMPAPKKDSNYLIKMQGFQKQEPEIYAAVLKFWQIKSAYDIKNPDAQKNILQELQDKLKLTKKQ